MDNYKALLDLANDAFFIADAETGMILEANQQACVLIGRQRNEIVGMHQAELHPAEEREKYEEIFRDHVSRGKAIEAEIEIIRSDGKRIPVEIISRTVEIDGKRVNLGIFKNKEITEIQEARQAAFEKSAYLDAIVQNSTDYAIVTTDENYVVSLYNPLAEEIFGYPAEDIVGRNVRDIHEMQGVAVDHFDTVMEKVRHKGEHFFTFRDDTRKDPRMIRVRIAAIHGVENNIIGYALMGKDVTRENAALEALRKSEEKYRDLVENISDVIYSITPEGVLTYISPAIEAFSGGYKVEELIGRPFVQFLHPEDAARVMQAYEETLRGSIYLMEYRVVGKDGSIRWIQSTTQPIMQNGKVVATQGVLRDITQRKVVENALQESEDRYALAARGTNDGIWDWDLVRDEIYYSPRWEAIIGVSEGVLGNSIREWFDRVHPDDLSVLKSELDAHRAQTTSHFQNEHRLRHSDGTYIWVLARGLAFRSEDGTVTRMAGSLTDITDRKRAEEQLLHDAFHDALTGLPNRALLMDRLQQTAYRAARNEGYHFALLFMDLDQFKMINDSLGHSTGDRLLIHVSERLKRVLRPGDTLARLGGDEFVIIVDDIRDLSDAVSIVQKINNVIKDPIAVDGSEIVTTFSIGITTSFTPYDKVEHFLRDADTAMYRAKAKGRGQFVIYDEKMHTWTVTRMTLESDVRRAIEEEEFFLVYQPVINLSTGKLSGFEVLLRWNHPEKGVIAPASFLPVAEETGDIIAIDRWVLGQTANLIQKWRKNGFHPLSKELVMNVNLSVKHFLWGDLAGYVGDLLGAGDVIPGNIILEITEGVFMKDLEGAVATCSALKKLGMKLAIDDFGTGYSSLSYLQNFPIDMLKIDRSFIKKRGCDDDASHIVAAILALGHGLNMSVIAEGIEGVESLVCLKNLGCDYAQGFYLGHPIPRKEAEELIASERTWDIPSA